MVLAASGVGQVLQGSDVLLRQRHERARRRGQSAATTGDEGEVLLESRVERGPVQT